MRWDSTKKALVSGLLWAVAFFAALARPEICRAELVVDAGYDLFQTLPGTSLTPTGSTTAIPLTGVPLGSFNFGGTVGTVGTGNADTIVHRLNATASTPAGGTAPAIPIQLVAL